MLTNDLTRDMYDKIGQVMTKKEFEERRGMIPQSMRYVQALGNSMSLAIFFVLIFLAIDKH